MLVNSSQSTFVLFIARLKKISENNYRDNYNEIIHIYIK